MKEYKENYMGTISWSRISCGAKQNMFGSEVKTDHPISIKINKASLVRDLSRDWIHPEESIVEIELTPAQWAEFLTAANMGEGVPCTIKRIGKERTDPVPQTKIIEHYEEETKTALDAFENSFDRIGNKIKDAMSSGKPLGKKFVEELLRDIDISKAHTVENLQFVKNSFNEDMANVMVKAKAEFNTWVESKIQKLGLESVKSNPLELSIE